MSEEFEVKRQSVFVLQNCSLAVLQAYETAEKKVSPTFEVEVGDNLTKWCLEIYPNGDKETSISFITFVLKLISSSSKKISGTAIFGLKGNTEKIDYETKVFPITGQDVVGSVFMSHAVLYDKYKGLIVDGEISFFCDLTLRTSKESADEKAKMIQTLAAHYREMFENKFLADFKLILRDKKPLMVHKVILAARSPVFFAMLQQDMKEAKEGVATVLDYDGIVMRELVRFIYCNEVKGLPIVARRLIYAADQYHVDDLRNLCLDEIRSSLDVENVLEPLVIAEQVPGTKNLFTYCLNLISRQIERVSATNEWRNLPADIALKMARALSLRETQFISCQSLSRPE